MSFSDDQLGCTFEGKDKHCGWRTFDDTGSLQEWAVYNNYQTWIVYDESDPNQNFDYSVPADSYKGELSFGV